jgi:hypothetical protein
MEQVGKTEIEKSETPEALYSAIEKCSAESEYLSRESAYREALNALIRFRKVYSKLPEKPDHQENAVAGLQDIMDWCVRAIDIVGQMVDGMDRQVIESFICKLNKLKGLPASGFPKFDEDVWKKAEDRAQRIVDKYQAGKKPPKGLSSYVYCRKRTKFLETASIISNLADVSDRKAGRSNKLLTRNSITTASLIKKEEEAYEEAHTEMCFYRAVEKIYRLMDLNYTAALAKLEESILIVFEECDNLNATGTGDLLDKYDELKGLKFQDRVVRLEQAYSIDSIVDTALFGANQGLTFGSETREILVDGVIKTLHEISWKIKKDSRTKQIQSQEKAEKREITMQARSSKDNWEAINSEYDVSKKDFGKKINFVSDPFKRKIIFRDVEHAFVLASQGFSKPALILAGGVIEELLRLYLEYKGIKPKGNRFVDYIEACDKNNLLKRGVSRLTDSVRDFRNLIHLENEKTKQDTVSKATAKGAVAAIFTIANAFQKIVSD